MADFYPLISRTVAGLPDNRPDTRARVYEKARETLDRHLRAADPPHAESEIMRQRLSLDEAILRIERDYAPAAGLADAAGTSLRPRAPTRDEAPTRGTAWRRWAVASVVTAATAAIGAYAFSLRDDPKRYQPATSAETPAPPEPPVERPKTSARIGDPAPPPAAPGDPPPAPAAAAPSAVAPPPPAPPAADTPAPEAPAAPIIAQRATLIRANEDRTKPPEVIGGRVVWRRVDSSAGEGKPVEPAVSIAFEFEQAGIAGTVLVRRNTDAALPATHTIEIVFTPRAGGDPVTEIQPPQFKDEETTRGIAIRGVPFPVGENLFVVALSALKDDAARNAEALADKGWIDLPFAYKSGRRAMITFERGVSGENVMKEALAAWAREKP